MSSACIRRHHQLPPLRIRMGSDVDWVLAGSGSLSSGSARSRAQLIAAQRLDPQVGIFPPPSEETSSTPPVKKSPWIERKEIVAVQSRASSAGQLAPIDTDKQSEEPKPRSEPRTSWTAELDAGENVGSSTRGHFRPLYVKFDSPPDLSALNNDSVVKGSFSLLPNRLSQSTLAGQGVGQEKLNQTWPPPTSGRRSPRIPKNSKRGRRILEPLNSSNPPDVSPRRGVSPVHRVSPSQRGSSPVPRAVSPLPRGASPAHRGVSSSPRGGRSPRGASPVPRSVSPATKGVSPMRVSAGSSGRHKMPPLSPRKKKDRMIVDSGFNVISLGKNEDIIDLNTIRKTRRRKRSTNKGKGIIAIEHDPPLAEQDRAESSSSAHGESAVDDCTIPQKPMLARQGIRHDMSQAGILSENNSKFSNGLFTPPAEPFLPPVDPPTPYLSRTQISPPPQQQDELEFKSLDENDEPGQPEPPQSETVNSAASAIDALEAEERALKFQILKEQEQLESVTVSPISVASAPAAIENPVTTTEVIELDTNSRGSITSLHNLQHSPPPNNLLLCEESTEDVNTEQPPPRPAYTTGSVIDLHLDVEDSLQNSVTIAPMKRTRRLKRGTVGTKNPARTLRGTQLRENTRTQQNSGLFPDAMRPVEKPKESLQQCFAQLDSPEWDVTMQGLQLLVRLLHNHPETIHSQLHNVIVALAKQVRNLRSQVARAACQASGELFLSQKRALETDLDEIASPLLHRTADTNKFLRADSNAALDKMIEVISPPRAVSVIVGKGIRYRHQNAIVRTACARLLVNLVSKVGVDKVMTHPGDMRDKILVTGANLLTEGSLDTRCFAKQLFRLLSTHSTFNSVVTEVIPSHVLRNISKTLQSLK